uniref:Reverse transcriptase domain-containing protein n=1 Tax=Strongyloides papillosus TaxID=174720 RepID=A0A0N5BXU9_STREA
MLIPCLRSSPIQIFPSKDVKQGDSLSPVLFIVALQGIISSVKNGLKSNHLDVVLRIKNPDNDDFTQLFYLAYTDNIAIFNTSQNTSEFLASNLEKHLKKAGLQLNRLKTETLTNSDTIKPIYKVSQQYKYLGQWLSFNKNHENLEISTRIRNSEIACKKVMPLMERTNSIKKKAFLYVQNIRPILTYGIETLNFTKASLQRIVNAEKRILRRCLKLKIGTTETEKNERRVKVTQLLEFCGDIHDVVSQKGEKLLEKVMNDDLMKLVYLWTPDKKRTV